MAETATTQRETRARRRIRKAVESRGFKLMTLEWQPIGAAAEKSGPSGGWYGTVDRPTSPSTLPGDDLMGLSVDETVAWVDQFFPTPEPCDCPEPTPHPMWSATPAWFHEPDCRWRLDYWLLWWGPHQNSTREATS